MMYIILSDLLWVKRFNSCICFVLAFTFTHNLLYGESILIVRKNLFWIFGGNVLFGAPWALKKVCLKMSVCISALETKLIKRFLPNSLKHLNLARIYAREGCLQNFKINFFQKNLLTQLFYFLYKLLYRFFLAFGS